MVPMNLETVRKPGRFTIKQGGGLGERKSNLLSDNRYVRWGQKVQDISRARETGALKIAWAFRVL